MTLLGGGKMKEVSYLEKYFTGVIPWDCIFALAPFGISFLCFLASKIF
jgi:hypothetical protein